MIVLIVITKCTTEFFRYYTQRKLSIALLRDVNECSCTVVRVRALLEAADGAVKRCEGNVPAVDLAQVQIDGPPPVTSMSTVRSPNFPFRLKLIFSIENSHVRII